MSSSSSTSPAAKRKLDASTDLICAFALEVVDFKVNAAAASLKKTEQKKIDKQMKDDVKEICQDLIAIYDCDESVVEQIFGTISDALHDVKKQLLTELIAQQQHGSTEQEMKNSDEAGMSSRGKRPKRS
jgi:hypothetical protein